MHIRNLNLRYLIRKELRYITDEKLKEIFDNEDDDGEIDFIIEHIQKTTPEYESFFFEIYSPVIDENKRCPLVSETFLLYILTKTKLLKISITNGDIKTRSILLKDITCFTMKQAFGGDISAVITHKDGNIVFDDFIVDYQEKREFLDRLEELR